MILKQPLINALQVKDKLEVNALLRTYKNERGQTNFPALFSIPSSQRLPEIARQDFKLAHTVISVGLTFCFESMNLTRPMSADQIIDLSDAIIETSAEDNLSLEDLLLFMQKLSRGEYGPMYEGMDIPKFMQHFDVYREQRWQAIQAVREEQAAQHGASADKRRMSELNPDTERRDHINAALQYMIDKAKPNTGNV